MFGLSGSSRQGRQPIEAGEKSVLDRARPDLARPADDGRHAEATFADGAFGVLEWRHAAIRPCEHLGAVIGGEDDDGVVGLTNVVDFLSNAPTLSSNCAMPASSRP